MGGFFKSVGKAISDLGKGVKKILDPVATVASTIPGPWQTAARVYTLGSTLFGGGKKSSNPAEQVMPYLQQGADAQMMYQQMALDLQREMMDRAMTTTTAEKQSLYDMARQQFMGNQRNLLPYMQASQGALASSLPAIQYLLGLNPTKITPGIHTYTPPELDYLKMYQDMGKRMFPASEAGGTTSSTGSVSGSIIGDPQPGAMPAAAPGSVYSQQGVTNLIPVESDPTFTYNIQESPLYQWQRKRGQEKLQGQLAAAGLSSGTYAQRELARQEQGLAAQERERTMSNLYNLANFGMGGASLGQQTFTPPSTGINPASIYTSFGNNMSSIYGNMGGIQGQLGAQMAQNMMAGYNAMTQANNARTDPLSTALNLAQQFGWLGGGGNSKKSFWSDPVSSVVTGVGDLGDSLWDYAVDAIGM